MCVIHLLGECSFAVSLFSREDRSATCSVFAVRVRLVFATNGNLVMSFLDTNTTHATHVTTEANQMDAVVSTKQTATFQCLVVSAHDTMREMLTRSVNEAGWDAVVCSDAGDARTAVQRDRFQMALVDLQDLTLDETASFRQLSERIASSPGPLLVLCGNEGDGMEEIWARQLGAWLYLPGVDLDSDLMSLCAEALPVAEKLIGDSAASTY